MTYDLAYDRAIIGKATPGPWQCHKVNTREVYKGETCLLAFETGNDAYFAIKARARWEAALDEIERLQGDLSKSSEQVRGLIAACELHEGEIKALKSMYVKMLADCGRETAGIEAERDALKAEVERLQQIAKNWEGAAIRQKDMAATADRYADTLKANNERLRRVLTDWLMAENGLGLTKAEALKAGRAALYGKGET